MLQGVWTSLWGWRQHLRSRLQTNSLGLSLRLGWVGSRWARKECAVDEENVSLNIRLFISSSDRHLEKLKLNLRWQNNGDRAHCIGYCHRFAAENTKKNTKKSFQESADFMQLDCSSLIFPVVGLCWVKVPAGKYFPRWATGPIRAVCERGGEGTAGDFGFKNIY